MQHLLFPEITSEVAAPFDGYGCHWVYPLDAIGQGFDHVVCVFKKHDTNAKRWYLVGERIRTNEGWVLDDVLEFRHAHDRAMQYASKREAELVRQRVPHE